MSQEIFFDKIAREKLLEGIDGIVNPVKITIGPKGRNVCIERGKPLVTNDGGTIARAITFKDRVKNMGASIAKNVIEKTSQKAGGGRTASAILTQELVHRGLKLVDIGMDMNAVADGMNQAKEDIKTELVKLSRPVNDVYELTQLATISTESAELGKVIAETMYKVGKDGTVTTKESQTFGITTEFSDGLEFDNGYVSPFMVNNLERMEAEFTDIPVYVTDKKITLYKDIYEIIKPLGEQGKTSLLVICEDFDGDALNKVTLMKMGGAFNTLAIKTPGLGDNKKLCLQDICALSGAELNGKLGTITQVISTKDKTKLIGGTGDLATYITGLKVQYNLTDSPQEKDQLQERISKLSNQVAIIKVGTASDTKLNYLKQKVEDGVNECKRALEDGIVMGGNVAFIHATSAIEQRSGIDAITMGYNLVIKAIEAPLRQIILNSNDSPDVIIQEILESNSTNSGYDAKTGFVLKNIIDVGIIDAVKVPITILENAVDEVSTFLTIGATISEEVDKITKEHIEY